MGRIRHVSDTAFLVAQCRAVESARADALFRDPLAARLSGDKGKALLAAFPTSAMTGWMVAIRTVVIDELVREAVARGADAIVNLGAGLDTRPYRLDLPPELLWIEVDYPDVIGFKADRLSAERANCRLERVGLDLSDLAARSEFLKGVGARARRPFVLTEGLVPYLTQEQAAALADDLRPLPGVQGWIVDYVSPESHAYRRRSGVTRHMRQAPFAFDPQDWFAFFAGHGWKARVVRYLPEIGERLGRRAPLPRMARVLMRLLGPIAPARRRNAFQRFSGYVVLEPS